ncbi:MobH family relaxase [Rhodanobacter sp. FW106-PBR-R2A-1-13]|uniref:MobH family relaxase n=1 Tax=Rhodanobacter sp. FW106-PBR-R2A-1-13 TaxID=3454845 RepID=UPI0034E384F5
MNPERVLAARAEQGSAPARTIDSFAAFAGPDQTVEAVEPEAYLHLLQGPIDMLRHEVGLDAAGFDKLVMPMLRRYLRWVHLLPASANHHHARLGGLATHGLDVAALAARNVHNAVLDYDPVYTRDLELKANRAMLWPLAAATAGLHHDLGKVLIDQIITCAATGDVWNPFVGDLLTWARAHRVDRYAVRWRPGDRLHRHESFGLLLMGAIAGPEVMGALSSLGRDMLESIVLSISGEREEASGLRAMVHQADQTSSRLDRDSGAAYWSEGNANVDPVVGRLLDAAATLIRRRAWKFNTPGHPVWVTGEGAYLVWPQAFNSMRQELVAQQKAVGVPNDPVEVAEIFVRARVAKAREYSNGQKVTLWALHLPGTEAPAEAEQSAFAQLLSKLGGVSNALYLPDPGLLVQGLPVSEAPDVRIARDPTLPEEVEVPLEAPAPVSSLVAEHDESDQAQPDGQHPPADDQPAAETAPRGPAGEAADDGSMGPPSPPASSHASASPPTLAEGAPGPAGPTQGGLALDSVPLAEHAEARKTLLDHGALGAVLEHIADKIALEPDSYATRDRLTMKNGVLLVRWPDAVRGEVKELRELADEIGRHPEWLATRVAGQRVTPQENGITTSVRIRGSAWNVVPLNETVSEAFNLLARRNAVPVSQDIP